MQYPFSKHLKRVLASAILCLSTTFFVQAGLETEYANEVVGATNIANAFASGTPYTIYTAPQCDCAATTDQDCFLRRRNLRLTLDAGETYQYGGLDWTYGLTLEIKAWNGGTQLGSTYTAVFAIQDHAGSMHEPEQVADIDLKAALGAGVINSMTKITISYPSTPAMGGTHIGLVSNSFRMGVELVNDIAPSIYECGGSSILASNLRATAEGSAFLDGERTNITFHWTPGNSKARFDHWQLQVAKAEPQIGQGASTVPVDWENAATYDLDDVLSYTVTLSEGTGFYVWRVRPVGSSYAGGWSNRQNYGDWDATAMPNLAGYYTWNSDYDVTLGTVPCAEQFSAACVATTTITDNFFYFQQFNEQVNWIHSRVFTEGNRQSEKLTFANGLSQPMQVQARLQSSEEVVARQHAFDFSARDALQSLDAPVGSEHLNYQPRFFESTSGNLFNANDFDDPSTIYSPSTLATGTGIVTPETYYNDGNVSTLEGQLVPQSQDFPFQRTLYQPDATGRVWKTAGVGATHQLKATEDPEFDHNNVHQYAQPAQDELDRIFGNEAPLKANVVKTQSTDENGVKVVTYTSNKGQTLATVLNADVQLDNLLEVGSFNPFPVEDILEPGVIDEAGMVSETYTSLLVDVLPPATHKTVTLDYKLSPKLFHLDCDASCGCDFCWECDYLVEIEVRNPQYPTDVNKNVTLRFVVTPDAISCPGTPDPEVNLGNITLAGNQIQILDPSGVASSAGNLNQIWPSQTVDLLPGTYYIYKRVYVNTVNNGTGVTHLQEAKNEVLADAENWTEAANCCGPFTPDLSGWDCVGDNIDCNDPNYASTLLPQFATAMWVHLTNEQNALVNNGNNAYISYLNVGGANLSSSTMSYTDFESTLNTWLCDLDIPSTAIQDCFDAISLMLDMNIANTNATATNNAGNLSGPFQGPITFDSGFDLFQAVEDCLGVGVTPSGCEAKKNLVFSTATSCTPPPLAAEELAAIAAATSDPNYQYYIIWHTPSIDPTLCPANPHYPHIISGQATVVQVQDPNALTYVPALYEPYQCYDAYKYPNAIVDGQSEAEGRAYLAELFCDCLSLTSGAFSGGGGGGSGAAASAQTVEICEDNCASKMVAFEVAIENYIADVNATNGILSPEENNGVSIWHPTLTWQDFDEVFPGEDKDCYIESMYAQCLTQCQLPLSTAAESFATQYGSCTCGGPPNCLYGGNYIATSTTWYSCWQDFVASAEFKDAITQEQLEYQQALTWGSEFAPTGVYSDFGDQALLDDEIIDYFYSSLNLNMMDRDVAVAPMLAAFPAPGIYPVDLSGSGWPANYYFTQQTAAFQYEDAGNVVKNIVAVTNVIWDDNPMPPPNNFSAVQDDIIKEINIAIYCEDQNPNTDPFATPILFWSYYPNDYMVTPECLLLQGHNPLGYKIQDQIVEFSVDVTGRFHAVLHDGVCQPTAVQYSANAVCTTEYIAAGEIQVTGSGGSHIWVEAGHSGNTQYLHGPVGWGGSAAQTASDLADAINNFNTSPNYTAEVNGTTVSIYVSKNVGEDPTVYDLLTSGTIASTVVSPFTHCAPETLEDVVATCGGTPTDTYSRECPYGFVKVTPFNYPKYDFTVTAPDHKALFVDDFKDFVNDALTEIAIHRTITPNPLFTFPTLPNYNCGPVEVVPNWKHYEKTKHYVINNNNYKAIVTMLGVEETVGGVLYKSFKGLNIELRCLNGVPGSTGKAFQFLLDGTRSHCGYYEGIFTQLIIGYNPNTGVYTGFNPVNTTINAIPDMISDIQFVDNNTNGIFDLIEFTFPQTGTHAQHNWANLGSSYQLLGTKFNTWWDGMVSSYVNPAPVSGSDIEALILGGTSCNPMSCDACMRWVEPEAFEVDLTTNFLTCEEQLAMYAQSQVNHYLENCLEDKLDEIDQTYKQNCLYGIEDEFKLGYELRYGGYTLYYHDRAGNLIRSVPPQGVKTLTPAEIQDVRDFRKDPVANAGSYTLPGHDMVTNYKYNSLKQLVETQTPDGHYDVNTSSYYPSRTWYNKVGHTVLSQSAEQSLQFPQEFSFYCFDGYERLVRSGQLTLANGHTAADLAATAWDTPYFPYASSSLTTTVAEVGGLSELHVTAYSWAYNLPALLAQGGQQHLENRVSMSQRDVDADLTTEHDQVTTWYSYDPHGNVQWMVQRMPDIGYNTTRYSYDVVSGNVKTVIYNPGTEEQFFQSYDYDEDNRITNVRTSADGLMWEQEADYDYYLHGPLRKVTYGEDRVQGMDYTYTLQGWLKSINQVNLDNDGLRDPGKDGAHVVEVPMSAFSGWTISSVMEGITNLMSSSVPWNGDAVTTASDVVANINTHGAGGAHAYLADNEQGSSEVVRIYVNNSTTGITVNSTGPSMSYSLGHEHVVEDEFAMEMGYYADDYYRSTNAIGADVSGGTGPAHNPFLSNMGPGGTGDIQTWDNSLYNGNIAFGLTNTRSGQTSIGSIDGHNVTANIYRYDQWNRLRINDFNPFNSGSSTYWTGGTGDQRYDEYFNYDLNGNINGLQRFGNVNSANPGTLLMDNLTFNYYSAAGKPLNRLEYVDDAELAQWSNDVFDMAGGNYRYNADGQLIMDAQEGISRITWNNLGKVSMIEYLPDMAGDVKQIRFQYDATGKRVIKEVGKIPSGGSWIFENTTYYVRGGRGRVLAVYEKKYEYPLTDCDGMGTMGETSLHLIEHHVYGSERLAVRRYPVERASRVCGNVYWTTPGNAAYTAAPVASAPTVRMETRRLGFKDYEVKDHLDNVRATLTDRRLAVLNAGSVDDHLADVTNWTDFYAFGSPVPGRHATTGSYRYGYNGMEKDDEVKGSLGTSYTTLYRQYDPRLGRWLSVDPKYAELPWQSPYTGMDNNPIIYSDPLGDKIKFAKGIDKSVKREVKASIKELKKDPTFKKVYKSLKADDVDRKIYDGTQIDIGPNRIAAFAPGSDEKQLIFKKEVGTGRGSVAEEMFHAYQLKVYGKERYDKLRVTTAVDAEAKFFRSRLTDMLGTDKGMVENYEQGSYDIVEFMRNSEALNNYWKALSGDAPAEEVEDLYFEAVLEFKRFHDWLKTQKAYEHLMIPDPEDALELNATKKAFESEKEEE